ncbi:hypothetical protein E3Q11_02625 [Wallemia mellicola]|nr:hypothetical protein E3Q11_02625 [Wallemia mellicola]
MRNIIRTITTNARRLESLGRDFRSEEPFITHADTITAPTDEMLAYSVKHSSRGDDVYGEDESTSNFEKKIAKMTGKPAAMFCVSGTMSNQIGLRTHLHQPPHSVLCDAHAHIYKYEAGGLAFHSQAQITPVEPTNGHHLQLNDIQAHATLEDDIHYAPTRIISLENTKNGLVFPQSETEKISEWASSNNLIMHLDGARIWNVSAATGLSIDKLCQPYDSVSLCLSKGIGAPIGSILVGSEKVITKAKWFRKLFGGGIRQSGFLAEAADFALENHFPLLPKTHERAKRIAEGFEQAKIRIISPVETSMVFFDSSTIGFSLEEFIQRVKDRAGITISSNRIVVHHQITDEAVENLVQVAIEMSQEKRNPLSSAIGQFGQIYQRFKTN